MAWFDFLSSIGAQATPNNVQAGGFSPATEPGPLAQFDSTLGIAPAATAPVNAGASFQPSLLQSFTGYTNPSTGMNQQGWGGLALGAASALGNSYMGMKQYGLAKDAFKESKRQYEQNFAAQRTLVNGQLEDRQRARVASNPDAYQSVGDYMNKNRIK